MAMVFISHDRSVVLRIADRVMILDQGRAVEEGPGSRILFDPRHPVTRALLAAAGRDLLFPPSGAPQPELRARSNAAHILSDK